MAWRVEAKEAAQTYLVEANHENPEWARALSLDAVIGAELTPRKNNEDALNAAVMLAPADPVVLTHAAYFHWNTYQSERTEGDSLVDVIRYANLAIEHGTDTIEPYSLKWRAQRARQQDVEALKTMMQAYERDPTSVDVNLSAGELLVSLQRPELAEPFLLRALNWSHSATFRRELIKLLPRLTGQDSRATSKAEPLN